MDNTMPIWKQLLLLIILIIAGFIIANICSILLLIGLQSTLEDASNNRITSLLGQFISQIGVFILPAIWFTKICKVPFFNYMKLNNYGNFKSYLYALAILMLALPVISYTEAINRSIKLPEFLSGLEVMMQKLEETNEKVLFIILDTTTIWGLLQNIFVIAIMAAIGEELIFRGILQKIFIKLTKSANWGIIITAVIFSAFHFQFSGFIPRVLLGLILGYTYYYFKSLGITMILHFLNNCIGVISYYLYKIDVFKIDPLKPTTNNNGSADCITALLCAAAITYLFYRYKTKFSTKEETKTIDKNE